jgi:hypothetical protein
MSRGSGSSVIPVAVFLALLFIVLPVSADNVTTLQTTVATSPTTIAILPTNVTTSPTTITILPTNVTTSPITIVITQTTVAGTQTTATPTNTTVAVTRTATVITPAKPTVSSAETVTTGSVNVYSSPAGASILIDGIYSGTTPGNVNGVPAGNHILRLELSGYYDYEGSIYVVPGQAAQGYGTLQPMSRVTSAAPTPTIIVPVIVPVVTATPVPSEDPGLLGDPGVLAAIIGAIAVIILSAAKIFIHVKPPKKE